VAWPASRRDIRLHHRAERLDPCRKTQPIEARPHFCKRFVHSPGRRRTSRCDISRHGVALLCGISTPSLPAQGGQRRPLQKFNRTRDIPESLIGNIIERLLGDKGYRGHNAPPEYKFRVFTSGQKRRVTPKIKRELRRRSAIEPVIGHLKSEHRMGRNYLWHRAGDAANAVLAAAGYNFRRLLRWLSLLLGQILAQLGLQMRLIPA
jgi:hypothetical protein